MHIVALKTSNDIFKVERCCYVCSDDEGIPGGNTAKKSRIDKGGANGLVTASPLGSKQTRYRSTYKYTGTRIYGLFTLPDTGSGTVSNSDSCPITEIGSRDLSPSLYNVNIFCIVECTLWVWNPSTYTSPSPSM